MPIESFSSSIGLINSVTSGFVEVLFPSTRKATTDPAMARQPEKVTPVVVDEPRKQPDTKQVPAEGNKITIQPVQPTAEEIEAKYVALIASGKEKMGKADFTNESTAIFGNPDITIFTWYTLVRIRIDRPI